MLYWLMNLDFAASPSIALETVTERLRGVALRFRPHRR